MRVEHKLPAATAAYAQRALGELQALREKYLAALGQAKELEFQSLLCQQSLSQALKLVEEADGLPEPIAPYRLSADGTALIGDVADAPAVVRVRNGVLGD
jgi:hypothetical protein